jgi:ATP diphosphatase
MPPPPEDALCTTPGGGLPRLLAIMARLRDPQTGCPWDIEQTYATIVPYTLEEAHEVADAIEREAWDELEGELGDLLLQVVYYAQMGAEDGRFDFHSVADRVADKMVARHPHIWGRANREKSAAQQVADWETVKAAERGGGRTLDGVARALPGLTRAVKLQKRLARVGFDWGATGDVMAKVIEEVGELADAQGACDADAMEDEMGDLLFTLANLARHLDIDPEAALRRTNGKVERRFAAVEDALARDGRRPEQSDLAEMDALWDEARRADKAGQSV